MAVFNSAGNQVKKFNTSLIFLILLIMSATAGLSLLGFFLYDYHNMQTSMHDMRSSMASINQMAQKIIDQRAKIYQQRLQIQTFAGEINSLKEKLVKLDQFEEQIRLIANLEFEKDKGGNPSGIGGATPDSKDSRLEISEGHENLIRKMHEEIDELESASHLQLNKLDLLKDELEDQRNLLAATPAIQPTKGWMTSRFGKRLSPFTGRSEFHKGVDIANRKGTPIVATADGVVSFAGTKNNMGKVVVIDHGHGILTRYAHLSDILKQQGEEVKRGDIIAQMGSTGRSTGPHLHYEVHLNGVPVNPQKYILN